MGLRRGARHAHDAPFAGVCRRELTASSVGAGPRDRSDAVALLMDLHANHSTEAPRRKPPVLIDLRRHDERSLYGSIPGAVHVPVDQWAEALDKVLPSVVPPAHPGMACRESTPPVQRRATYDGARQNMDPNHVPLV